jgi:hypothetical protein
MRVGTSSSAIKRVAKRVKVFQPAMLVADGRARRVHLLDVSAAGALVHAQEPVAKGAQVRVECAGVVRDAAVRWSEGKRFGLLFERQLSAEQVGALAAITSDPPRTAA